MGGAGRRAAVRGGGGAKLCEERLRATMQRARALQ